MSHAMDCGPFRRQPEKVTITIDGAKPDIAKVFHELMWHINNLPYGADFEVTPTQTKIFLHPWAVND